MCIFSSYIQQEFIMRLRKLRAISLHRCHRDCKCPNLTRHSSSPWAGEKCRQIPIRNMQHGIGLRTMDTSAWFDVDPADRHIDRLGCSNCFLEYLHCYGLTRELVWWLAYHVLTTMLGLHIGWVTVTRIPSSHVWGHIGGEPPHGIITWPTKVLDWKNTSLLRI